MNVWTIRLAVAAGLAYLAILGYAMANFSYDVWGVFALIPILVLMTVPIVDRMFVGRDRDLFPIAMVGLAAKTVGAFAYFWIAFDAFGGGDFQLYHDAGRVIARQIRTGELDFWEIIPHSQGTQFISEFTGLVYAIFGSSRLGGFVLFAWLSYWGSLFFVKAAILAVPGLARRNYALLVMLLPSIVLWSSTIGKESVVGLGLGIASYGAARLFAGRWGLSPVAATAAGLFIAGYVRPHFAALWVGAMVVALIVASVTGNAGRGRFGRLGGAFFAVVGLVALLVVAQITLSFLDPSGDEGDEASGAGDRITSIFETTEKNTTTGGSQFDPVVIRGPRDYPNAVFRTLTRPLITEARGLNQLLPAAEVSFLFLLGAVSWRRVTNLPRMLVRYPYVTFAVVVLIGFGIAWASFGNLGLLVRQRSVVAPFLVLLVCLPARVRPTVPAPGRHTDLEPAPAVPV